MFIVLDTFSGIRYGEWLTQIVRPNLPLGVAKVTHCCCSSEVLVNLDYMITVALTSKSFLQL